MNINVKSSSVAQESPNSPTSQVDPETSRQHFRLGMIAKTTLAMVIVGLVPLTIFGLISLAQQNARLRTDAEQSMQSSAERVSLQVDDWVDKNVRVLRTAASLGSMSSMSREEQAKILTAIRQAYPWMYLVFTVNRDGKNVARSDTLPLADYSDRKYFTETVAGGKEMSWETLIGKTSGKPALVLAVPIRANGAVIGALAAAMNIEDISRIVATWKAGATGHAFLVDETAKVVAHPHSQFVLMQRRLTDHPLVRAYGTDASPHILRFRDEDSTEVLGAVHGNRMQWAVVVQQNTAELLAPLQQTLRLGIGLLVGAAVLVGLFALVLSRMLVKPIVDMTRAADQMSLGNLDTPISTNNNDEIGLLAESLERLRKSMRLAVARFG